MPGPMPGGSMQAREAAEQEAQYGTPAHAAELHESLLEAERQHCEFVAAVRKAVEAELQVSLAQAMDGLT